MKKIIEISKKETNHQITIETATVFDNGNVLFQRTVRTKLTGEEIMRPNAQLTIKQLQSVVKQMEEL